MNREDIIQYLEDNKIEYKSFDHRPVFTVEDMIDVGMDQHGTLGKNLFLRDQKGRRHFLVILPGDKAADLNALSGKIGSTKLSFGSDERLKKHLGAEKGGVSPFAILNNTGNTVEVVIDKALLKLPSVGFHPNSNETTVFVAFDDVVKMIEEHGNDIVYVDI